MSFRALALLAVFTFSVTSAEAQTVRKFWVDPSDQDSSAQDSSTQVPPPPPPPQFSQRTPQELTNRVERLAQFLRRDAYTLSPWQVAILHELLDPIDSVLRGGPGPFPGPGPNPGPGPWPGPGPMPAPAIISGSIESKAFNISVSDAYDFFTQCSAQTMPQSADEATVSVNFGASQRLTPGRYMYSAADACSLITATAVTLGLGVQQYPSNVVVAIVEQRTPIVMTGSHLVELNTACLQANFTVPQSADELTVQVNWKDPVRKTPGYYMRTKEAICQVILTEYQAQVAGRPNP